MRHSFFLGLLLSLGLGLSASASAQTTVVVTSTSTPTSGVVVPTLPANPSATPAPTVAPGRTDGRVTSVTADTDSEIRQREELSRIDAGIRSGVIDARESVRLTRAMAGLQQYQERAYADGVLTLREQARLARLHTRLDRAITRAISR
jgi:hypothetical protein